MNAKPALVALALLLAQPALAAKLLIPVLPFDVSLTCVIKPTSNTTAYLALQNPTGSTIAANTRVNIKTDHSAPFSVTLNAALLPGGWWNATVPVDAKHCTARTASLLMQLPQQQLSP